ncbi:MAG: UDP-N-acetylmuramoyl-L-alanyl-D-glutamate--2,6-diaminopimelate ligase [Chloroflexi bacterium]|nr:UDP-N-acetylmuramoyl-L-alanyl-D-glutamate--2,6-diaminopimelate ligase [Chloroflexota bacterium]
MRPDFFIAMQLTQLLESISDLILEQALPADPEITAPIAEDSRAIQSGGVFLARRGQSSDGHAYIQAAMQAGAVAVVGERSSNQVDVDLPYVWVSDAALALARLSAAFHGYPARKLTMIGITGTDGKTTTTNLLYSVLREAGVAVGMISTINAVIGSEVLSTGLHVTTPTAPEVQAYLAQMVNAGLTHCILEATSHGLAQRRVAACDFDLAIITNIQHEHLDFHGSFEAYREAKALLFRDLAGSHRKATPKTAVINLDDTNSADYLLAIPAERQVTYSLSKSADCQATTVDFRPAATHANLRLPDATNLHIDSALVGAFNVSNMLAAAAAADALGVDPEAIKAGLEAVTGIPGRMERIDEGQDFLALVDFAHTPNALSKALDAGRMMAEASGGRLIVAFGSAGLRDPKKRVLMAQIAAQQADLTVLTAEDPRTESLDDILQIMADAMKSAGGTEDLTFWRVPDRGQALFKMISLARPGDVVMACGKGHEQSMAFGTTEYPWDDRDALRAALRGTPLRTLPTASNR